MALTKKIKDLREIKTDTVNEIVDVNTKDKKYTKATEEIKYDIANSLLKGIFLLFVLQVILIFILITINNNSVSFLKEIILTFISASSAIVGGIVGYYFKSYSKN